MRKDTILRFGRFFSSLHTTNTSHYSHISILIFKEMIAIMEFKHVTILHFGYEDDSRKMRERNSFRLYALLLVDYYFNFISFVFFAAIT